LAEDDEVNVRVAKTMLERLGCLVDVAINGGEAVEYFRRRTYDLVLMDSDMPVMDGFEATVRIRDLAYGRRTPILGTTASGDRARCLSAGMNDVVPKPFERGKLQAALERWVTRNHDSRE
jgi:CheY-like chemotaxis protein